MWLTVRFLKIFFAQKYDQGWAAWLDVFSLNVSWEIMNTKTSKKSIHVFHEKIILCVFILMRSNLSFFRFHDGQEV